MTQLSKKLEQLIRSSKEVLPVKTERGILVGDVLIISEGSTKHIEHKNQKIYSDIHLNVAAIKIANLLAQRKSTLRCEAIYKADQEYGKWFIDSQLLRTQYEKAVKDKNHDRADYLWARYLESRDRTIYAKNRAESLCSI